MKQAMKSTLLALPVLAVLGLAACAQEKEKLREIKLDSATVNFLRSADMVELRVENDYEYRPKDGKPIEERFPLHFPGETVLAHMNFPLSRWEVVTSCAPEKSGCSVTKLKVRSLSKALIGKQKWQFANVEPCPRGLEAWEAYDKAVFKTQAKQKKFKSVIAPCLQTSYMGSPYERGPKTPRIPVE